VKQDRFALQYASSHLSTKEQLLLAAVKQDEMALRFASDDSFRRFNHSIQPFDSTIRFNHSIQPFDSTIRFNAMSTQGNERKARIAKLLE